MNNLFDKKILMVIAFENFRDEEYLKPKEVLETAGAQITTASTQTGEATGMLGAKVPIEITLAEVDAFEYDAIVVCGGTGANLYWDDELFHEILRMAQDEDKLIAAICISPVTLANAGLLKNKKATCWPDVKEQLIKGGVGEYTDQPVVADGKIITANGPEAAEQFGNVIVQALS